MAHAERNTLIALLSNLILNAYVVWRLVGLYGSGALDGPDAPMLAARMLIWIICVAIVIGIALAIASNVIAAALSRGDASAWMADERDRLFEIRGLAATMAVAVAGFLLAFAALAWGVRPVTAILTIYFGFAAGSLVGDLVRMASYRAGG